MPISRPTDEQQVDIYPAATIETAAIGTESNYYNIVNDAAHVVPVSSLSWYGAMSGSGYNNSNGSISNPGNPNPTGTSANVYRLNGQTGDKYGLGITLKVMAGDQVSIFAKSFWHNTGTAPGSFPISSVLSSFVAGVRGDSCCIVFHSWRVAQRVELADGSVVYAGDGYAQSD